MRKLILLAVLLLAVLSFACGGDDDDTTNDVTEAPSATESGGTTAPTDGGDAVSVFTSSQLPLPVTITTGEGWEIPEDADLSDIFAVLQTESPRGYIDFLQPTQVYTYASISEVEEADPPADYVAWLSENPLLTVVTTTDATVGGLPAQRLEITNNDNDSFALFKMSDGESYDLHYRDHIYAHVVDVDGAQVLVMCGTTNMLEFESFRSTCEDQMANIEFGQ